MKQIEIPLLEHRLQRLPTRAGRRATVAPRDSRNRNSLISSSAEASEGQSWSETGAPTGDFSAAPAPDADADGIAPLAAIEPVAIMSRTGFSRGE